VLSPEGIETRSGVRRCCAVSQNFEDALLEERITHKDGVQIHARIDLAAIRVGNVLVLVSEHPGTLSRGIVKLEPQLKIEVKIKLCFALKIDRDAAHRRNESGSGGAKKLEFVSAEQICFKSQGFNTPAVNDSPRAG